MSDTFRMAFEKVTIRDATLYRGDCMEILPTLGKVDAVITDPPYGIEFQSARRTETERFAVIEGDGAPAIDWIPLVKIRAGGSLICFCRWDVAEAFRSAIVANGFNLKSQVIWDRVVHGLGDLEAAFSPRHDTVWFATSGAGFAFPGKRPASVIRHIRVDPASLRHPCEKPVGLMAELVESITRPRDMVIDPYMGVASTGVACARLGRKFIGIEIERKYFDIACKRIEDAYNQNALFDGEVKREEQLTIDAPEARR